MKKSLLRAALPLIALSAAACVEGEETSNPIDTAKNGPADPQYTDDGKLRRPEGYREWIYLSSGLGMSYSGLAPEDNPPFDNVFVHPDAYRAFMKTGTWPDKTMFALELRVSASQGSINKAGHFQQGIIALEAAVKDQERFPEAWAYFGFETPEGDLLAEADPFPKEACFSCHAQNAAVENTFVQFYPTLFEVAESHGTLRPDYPK